MGKLHNMKDILGKVDDLLEKPKSEYKCLTCNDTGKYGVMDPITLNIKWIDCPRTHKEA